MLKNEMKNKIGLMFGMVLISLAFLVFISSFVSAHAYGFDQSYTNYSLTASVTRDSQTGKYTVIADFALCRRDITNMVFPASSRSGIGWCIGNSTKCCGSGINETTKECNTLSCDMAYQVTCSIFGKTNPIKSCMRACMLYPQEAANYEQILAGIGAVSVTNYPRCLQYGAGKSDAYVWRKTFVLDSLTTNTVISAGAEFRRSGSGDGWLGVPIYIKPLDYYNSVVPPACTPATAAVDCNDNNICTTDSCVSGSCSYTNNANNCDDGDSGTIDDSCYLGICIGSPNSSFGCGGADFNNDGKVDLIDFNTQKFNIGKVPATHAGGDANGDGVINDIDVAILRVNMGKTCSVVPPQTSCTADTDCNDGDACTIDSCPVSCPPSNAICPPRYCLHVNNVSCSNSNNPNVNAFFYDSGLRDGWSVNSLSSYDGLGDFNGDGRTDILGLLGSNFVVCSSNGNSAGVGACINNQTPSLGVWPNSPSETFSWKNFGVGDFDGNVKDDIFGMSDNVGSYIGFSNGTYFLNRTSISSDSYSGYIDAKSVGIWCDPRHVGSCVNMNFTKSLIGDFNGDGKDDLILKNLNGEMGLAVHNGTLFNKVIFLGLAEGLNPTDFWVVGNFDDSGKERIITWAIDGKVYIDKLEGSSLNRSLVGDFGRVFDNLFVMHSNNSRDYIVGISGSGEAYVYTYDGISSTENFAGYINGFSGMSHILAADFDADGNSEIIARDAAGNLTLIIFGYSAPSDSISRPACDNDDTCDIALGENIDNCFNDCTFQPCGGADFNGDGVVDSQDLSLFNVNIGKTNPTNYDGDANGDGIIDAVDLGIFQQNEGRTCEIHDVFIPGINCSSNADCPIPTVLPQQYCNGTQSCVSGVLVPACNSPGTISSYCSLNSLPDSCSPCANGCNVSSGSCNGVISEATNCSDSDGGLNYSVKGEIYKSGGVIFTETSQGDYNVDSNDEIIVLSSTTARLRLLNGIWINVTLNGNYNFEFGEGEVTEVNFISALNRQNNIQIAYTRIQDMCSGNTLIERTCSPGGDLSTTSYECPLGCSNGACLTDVPPTCTLDSQCNDTNVCTTDSCNVALGTCSSVNNAASCNDNNANTVNDVCSVGVCSGVPRCVITSMNWGSSSVVGNNNVDILLGGNNCVGREINVTVWVSDVSDIVVGAILPLNMPFSNTVSWQATYDSNYQGSSGYFFKVAVDGIVYSSKDFGGSLLRINNTARTYMTRTIALNQGKNSFSLPLILDSMAITSVFSTILDKVDRMYTYDHKFKVYNSGRPSNLQLLQPAKGYVIFMKQAANLTINGSKTYANVDGSGSEGQRPQRVLNVGWNLIGPFSETLVASSLLSEVNSGGIYTYNENSKTFELVTNTQMQLDNTESYWIYMNQAVSIPITGDVIYG